MTGRLQYTLVGTEDGSNLSVFVPGRDPQVAHSSHPNFDTILVGVLAGDESVIDLFDVAQAAGAKFESLSERVSAKNGRLYLDGEEVNNALAEQVCRFLSEGVEDWKPLVAFFENVQANPNEHSREQLYGWLSADDFTITPDGLIVGYKGVAPTSDGGFQSINAGRAIVNGEEKSGRIPQNIGDVVEMPRSEVTWDPSNGCSVGLHVGTYGYANGFAQGALLEVHVNPRDVVSVPTDSSAQKMRCCRYTVIGTIDQPYTTAVRAYDDNYFGWGESEDDDDVWGDDDWGDGEGEPGGQITAPARTTVEEGNVFESTDSRRGGKTFTVEKVSSGFAKGKWSTGSTRVIQTSRLLSSDYRRVN